MAYMQEGQMRTITLEEHFATPAFLEGPAHQLKTQVRVQSSFAQIVEKLCDLGEGRIAAMDAAGIDMQVLSLNSPGVEQLEPAEAVKMAQEMNDSLAEAVKQHPDRFAGLAALPTPDPQAAAKELERTVQEYRFKGAVINGHSRGRYLDDEFFWPILEKAEALGVPIYLHPVPPPPPVIQASYTGNFSPQVAYLLSTSGWGWHIETATHILRVILSGAFDHYPRLQFIIGHMGEALPFMQPRIEANLSREATGLKRPTGEYFRENLSYTFSGFNYLPLFLNLLMEVGAERILFSADYPYRSMEEARAFLDRLPVSPADKERIAHGNAERLLGL